MKHATYKKISNVTLVVSSILSGFIVYAHVPQLLAFLWGGVWVSVSFLKAFVQNPIKDERIEKVSNAAAQTSFASIVPILTLVSMFLLTFSSMETYYLRAVGIVLLYVLLLSLAIYCFSYLYFNRKTGG